MKIDVALGTLGRFQQFKRVMHCLNDQSVAEKISVFIMDGNEEDVVAEFMNNKEWKFGGIKIYKERKVIKEKHWGRWPILYNFLFKEGKSQLVTYWSDDIFPDKNCFKIGTKQFKDGRVGAAAFAWRDGEGKPYKIYGTEMHRQVMVNFGLFRRAALKEVGYIDEKFHFYNADQDLSLKIWYKNYKVVRCPEAKATHYQGKKSKNKYRGGDYHKHDVQRFMAKWAYNHVRNKTIRL